MNKKSTLTEAQMNEYVVLLKLSQTPFTTRLTYDNKNSARIIQIEELDASEVTKYSCKFKGRSSTGNGCEWLKEIKKAFTGMKPKEWIQNEDVYIDSHYRIY